MNAVAGTTKRLILPNVTVNDLPLNTVDVGEYVRYAILNEAGEIVRTGSMANMLGSVGDWYADVTIPEVPGRHKVVFTVKTDMGNEETTIRLEVDPRLVALV
jgi:hypothetical protein